MRRILAVGLVLALATACSPGQASSSPSPGVTVSAADVRTVPVQRGSVDQTIRVSGSVRSETQYRLGPKQPGRLAERLVAAGDRVQPGQVLARLETDDLQAATLAAQARYDQTVAGATPEDLALAKTAVDSAQKTLAEAKRSSATDLATAQQGFARLSSAYASAKNGFQLLGTAVPTDSGAFTAGLDGARFGLAGALTDFTTMSTADITTAKATLGQADAALANAQTVGATQLATALTQWTSARDKLVASWLQFDGTLQRGTDASGAVTDHQSAQLAYATASTTLQTAVATAGASVAQAQTSVALAQNALGSPTSRTDPGLDKVRADLSGLQSTLASEAQLSAGLAAKLAQLAANAGVIADAVGGSYVAAQQAVAGAHERSAGSVLGAQNAYDGAVASLNKVSAPPKAYDVAAAYAALLGAQSALDGATIRAPAAGTVLSISAEQGETVAGPFIVLNASTLQLFGTVGENDVARLGVGQRARVRLDAIGGAAMSGTIVSIDPGATQGSIPLYGVAVTIADPDAKVRTGMSGSADIVVDRVADVLVVPRAVIRSQGTRVFVQVVDGGQLTDRVVKTGATSDTLTEIASGLAEGEVVAYPRDRTR